MSGEESQKKRKICKVVISSVSVTACEQYSATRNRLKDAFEGDGRSEIPNKKHKRDEFGDFNIMIFSFTSKSAVVNKLDSSLIIQKSRNHFNKFLLPNFINNNSLFASGLTMHNLFSIAMRKHANSSALVAAPVRGAGSQKHLQTTRCEAIIAVSEITAQCTNEITLAIARSLLCSRDPAAIFDPGSMHAFRPSAVIELPTGAAFLACSSSLCFSETAPRFLSPHDLLAKVMRLAKDQAERRVATSRIPQSTHQLQDLLAALAYSEPDGGHVWRAIAVVHYLSTSEVGRELLGEYGVTPYATAVVNSVASFSRFVVSNRARREAAAQSEQAKQAAAEATAAMAAMAAASKDSKDAKDSKDSKDAIADVGLDTISLAVAASRMRALSRRAQRKISTQLALRSADDVGIYSGVGLVALLDFIIHALASPQADFLKLLVSERTLASKEAGTKILSWQLGNGGEHSNSSSNGHSSGPNDVAETVDEASRNSAVVLRAIMLRILLQTPTESPALQIWKCRCVDDAGNSTVSTIKAIASKHAHVPLCSEDATPSPHMVLVAEKKAFSAGGVAVAWVSYTSSASEFGAIEALVFEKTLEEKIQSGELGGRAHRIHSAASEIRNERLSAPLPSSITGTARSILAMRAWVNVSPSMLAEAEALVESLVAPSSSSASSSSSSSPLPEAHASAPVSSTPLRMREPELASSPVTVGLLLQEAYRTAVSSCNKPRPLALFFCAPHTEQQVKREIFTAPAFQPSSLLHVVDVKFQPVSTIVSTTVSNNASTTYQAIQPVHMAMSLTVAAEHPIPLLDAMRMIGGMAEEEKDTDRPDRPDRPDRLASYLRQQRALVLLGAVQALALARTANAAAARESTIAAANTHHIVFPDNHRHLFPTLSQLFVVGLCNVPLSFATTPWEGVYGGCYETGAVGDVGLGAQNMTSDRRHVPVVVSQDHIDKLAASVAATCCVEVGSGGFAEIPLELRGVLRGCVVGVHACLNPLGAAFENVRDCAGVADRDTTMAIQCLPISPMTEAVMPQINAHWVDRSEIEASKYLYHDATPRRQSVLGPFFDAARVRAMSLADNPYESIEENMQVCILIASMLHAIECEARALLGVNDLKTLLEIFFLPNKGGSTVSLAMYAVDCYVLFCCLFPCCFEVGKPVLPLAAQTLPRLVHQAQNNLTTINEAMERGLISDDAATDAMQFIAAITDSDVVWSKQMKFIQCVGTRLSSFETCPVAEMAGVHDVVEAWARSTWHVHQAMELDTSPIYDLPSPDHVVARDILSVYVDRPSHPDVRRQKQRGGLVGLPSYGFIQICQLLNAASTIAGTRVQYFRNEGGVTLRPSGCALKAELNGHSVSNKSISPVQSECDLEAFGTKTAKEDGARRQVAAFEANNLLLIHITRHVSPPSVYKTHTRGASASVHANTRQHNALAATGLVAEEEVEGVRALLAAARSTAPAATGSAAGSTEGSTASTA